MTDEASGASFSVILPEPLFAFYVRDTVAVRWLVLLAILTACAGPLEPGRLPTAEERCAMQGGIFLGAGICHTPDRDFP